MLIELTDTQENIENIRDNHINIVYAVDDNFCEVLGVSITSLFSSAENENLSIYIIENNVSNSNKNRINSLSKKYLQHKIHWIQASDISSYVKSKLKCDRGSYSQYSRLLLGSLLPLEVQKVLYLDCDIVVQKSLLDLWNTDLKENTIGAVEDAFSKYYRKNIDLHYTDKLFNSGVILVDLEKWRKKNIESQLLRFIDLKGGIIQMGDQGVLNHVLSQDFYSLHPRYNAMTIFFDFSYISMHKYRSPAIDYYSEEEIKEAVNAPTIIHFTSSFKSKRPWVKNCTHKYGCLYLYYKDMSPWKDTPLRNDPRSWYSSFLIKLLGLLPDFICIRILSILQIYVRPLLFRICH